MLCQPPLHNIMNQPYTYRYPLPFGLPSHLGYHSALDEFLVLYSMFPSVVHFIHSINNVYVSIPVSQFLLPHPFPSWYPYICSLHWCLYFCFAAKITYTIFLDSTYMRYYTIFAFLFLELLQDFFKEFFSGKGIFYQFLNV